MISILRISLNLPGKSKVPRKRSMKTISLANRIPAIAKVCFQLLTTESNQARTTMIVVVKVLRNIIHMLKS